ncbi:MAG: Purine nucleoside phosphorylase 1 [Ignavibacteria bacterium]|nr:Purine nucleoside phosphorylase 1 [Ignavibacteria bacterium]
MHSIIRTGIILGSGLSKFADELRNPEIISIEDKGVHKISAVTGKIENKDVLIFSGRKHFYEGYPPEEVIESVRLASEMGVRLLVITNAAGGINSSLRVSDLMLIHSHYNFYNKRFPVKGEHELFRHHLIKKLIDITSENKLLLKTGNYCCTYGPMYETRSEIRMLGKYKIDAVGMSTVPEITYAAEKGIPVIGISCITNLLRENSSLKTNHDEVLKAGKKSYKNFSKLLKLIINNSDLLTE